MEVEQMTDRIERGRLTAGLRFAVALVATNLKSSFALRGAFWLQAGFMVANNLLFFVFWWIFFDRFQEVRGWRLDDVMVLFGVVATGFGVAVVFAGGVRELSRTVSEGELDVFLTQPKSPLLHVVASRTQASGWGDMLSGLGFLAASGAVGPAQLPLVVVAVTCSATVFVASGVILHSGAFWLGRVETLARHLWDFLVTFSTYPRSLFAGALKLMLFTVVPAGFIGYLPAELLRGPQTGAELGVAIAAAVGGAVAYSLLAFAVFRAGLRRYESGNRFGVRA
jgi:ABC-2 type transport system permease protein